MARRGAQTPGSGWMRCLWRRRPSTTPENPLAHRNNRLIDLLPPRERQQLLAVCEPVPLLFGEVLGGHGSPTTHAYFPGDGFVSLTTQVDGHPGLEVGMVGDEGMVGVQLALDVPRSPWEAVVQSPGMAWRVGAVAFRRELARSPGLRHCLNHYVAALMVQRSTAAGCQRFHAIGPRLARWLLMSHDRAHADRFHVTHEFLARMLGVRRVGITVAAGDLQRRGLISYHRGELTVRDRSGLEVAACACYAADRMAYDDAMDRSTVPA